MLDKTIIQNNSKEYIPYSKDINIKIGRAPTDESVKLLKEFEEKAMMKLIYYGEIKQNELTVGKIHMFQVADHVNKVLSNIHFSINGKEFNFQKEFVPKLLVEDVRELLVDFYKCMADAIAEQLMRENLYQLVDNFKRI